MKEEESNKETREVPVYTFEEYMEALKKGKLLTSGGTRCYKIREEDKERFLEYIKTCVDADTETLQ